MLSQIQAHHAPAYGLNELVKHIIRANIPTRMIMISLACHHIGSAHRLQDNLLDIGQYLDIHRLQDILSDTLGMDWTFEDRCPRFPVRLP